MVNKEEIVKETIKMVGESILILDDVKTITPEHFEMPVRFALDRYEEQLNSLIKPNKKNIDNSKKGYGRAYGYPTQSN